MTVYISNVFLVEIVQDSLLEVDTFLIGYGRNNPKDVGQLVGEVGILTGLKRLVAVLASHDTCHLAGFLSENSHVGKRREIADTDGCDPLVNNLLKGRYGDGLLCHDGVIRVVLNQ